VRSSIPQSSFVPSFTELDPWGAEVFTSDPYLDDPEFSGGRGESGPVYPAYGDISMPSTGCTIDGVYALCDFQRNVEALAVELREGGKTKQFPIERRLLGIFAVWIEDTGTKLDKPQTPIDVVVPDVIVTNIDEDGLGHWESIQAEGLYGQYTVYCSIEVRSKGRISPGSPPFHDGPDHKKLGPYVGKFDGFTDYSFRFEVRGSVTNGIIGKIGERDLNNGGEWTIKQTIHPLVGSNRNGKSAPQTGKVFDDSPKYLASDKAGSVTLAVDGGTFVWHDGPGFIADKDSPLVSATLIANFTVEVTNGTKSCQVTFNIISSFEKGKWTAMIKPGHLEGR
jgi:hypothetical protein